MWSRAAMSPQTVQSLYLWDSGISLLIISVSSQGTVSNTFLPTWQVNLFLYLHRIRHNPVSLWYSLWLHPETLSSHYGQRERLRLWKTYCCDPVYSAEECQLQTQSLFLSILPSLGELTWSKPLFSVGRLWNLAWYFVLDLRDRLLSVNSAQIPYHCQIYT